MSPDETVLIRRTHQERTGCTPEQAASWLCELEGQGHYLADVFSG